MRTSIIRHIAAAIVLAAASGCGSAPDLSAVEDQRRHPVQRHDHFQALAGNGLVLVAAASSGAVVSTPDGGQSWSRAELASDASVIALTDCPDGSFAGADFKGRVWLGERTGTRWQAVKPDADFTPMDIDCAPDGRLWVVGSYAVILSSNDGGKTWADHSLGEDQILKTVQFLDERTGIVMGEYGLSLLTIDGGQTWVSRGAVPGELYPYDTHFADIDEGWVVGPGGKALQTVDGGTQWTDLSIHENRSIFAITTWGDRLVGVAQRGQILALDPAKKSWIPLDGVEPVGGNPVALTALSDTQLLVAGAGGSLTTRALAR